MLLPSNVCKNWGRAVCLKCLQWYFSSLMTFIKNFPKCLKRSKVILHSPALKGIQSHFAQQRTFVFPASSTEEAANTVVLKGLFIYLAKIVLCFEREWGCFALSVTWWLQRNQAGHIACRAGFCPDSRQVNDCTFRLGRFLGFIWNKEMSVLIVFIFQE